jgi:hypothetical protein
MKSKLLSPSSFIVKIVQQRYQQQKEYQPLSQYNPRWLLRQFGKQIGIDKLQHSIDRRYPCTILDSPPEFVIYLHKTYLIYLAKIRISEREI